MIKIKKYKERYRVWVLMLSTAVCIMSGCGKPQESMEENDSSSGSGISAAAVEGTGIGGESAQDAQVDFYTLKKENSDIFAWIYVPDTRIDVPVLQSSRGDDFYQNHNAYGDEDGLGAAYIEIVNLASMCDFNTVIHCGDGAEERNVFGDLYQFADPDYFDTHEKVYLYMEDNVLTYEVFAAYERENTSLLRSYDFTYLSGCYQFLNDLYGTRDLNMRIREGWENVSPYHFLITLTLQNKETPDRQFVVVAILIEDAAGKIERVVAE